MAIERPTAKSTNKGQLTNEILNLISDIIGNVPKLRETGCCLVDDDANDISNRGVKNGDSNRTFSVKDPGEPCK